MNPNELPIGTKAFAINGGWWIKKENGRWKWLNNGGSFPSPGGDWIGDIELPPKNPPKPVPFKPKS